MKVICKFNKWEDIKGTPVSKTVERNINNSHGDTTLDLSKEYTVYGIAFVDNTPWYHILMDDYCSFTVPYPAEFFEVTDDRLSSYWRLFVDKGDPDVIYTSLVFPEWGNSPMYYERLLDAYEEEVETFKKYKLTMDREF